MGNEVSNSEVSGDSGAANDVTEAGIGDEVGESEMEEDLPHEPDASYDSYIDDQE